MPQQRNPPVSPEQLAIEILDALPRIGRRRRKGYEATHALLHLAKQAQEPQQPTGKSATPGPSRRSRI